jgi:hypothetical protein
MMLENMVRWALRIYSISCNLHPSCLGSYPRLATQLLNQSHRRLSGPYCEALSPHTHRMNNHFQHTIFSGLFYIRVCVCQDSSSIIRNNYEQKMEIAFGCGSSIIKYDWLVVSEWGETTRLHVLNPAGYLPIPCRSIINHKLEFFQPLFLLLVCVT